MTIPLLDDIVIIFGLSSVVLLIFYRLSVPTVLGFLLTGVLAGPHGLGVITAVHDVEVLAEIGVVLLMFTIGLEFSLQHLIKVKKAALIGGTLQVLLTCLVGWLVAAQSGAPANRAVFMGLLIALSSTTIVLKLLQERAEMDSAYGQVVLAILIFQDIIIVPIMLFIPILAGATANIGHELLVLLAKGIGIIAFVLLSAHIIVPQLLYQIARTRSRELFSLAIVLICFAVAGLTSSLGLSLALGAFLAGLIISESEYSHQALGHAVPFRDIFTSFFFVSIGMLLDVEFLFRQPVTIALISLGVLALKAGIAGTATLLLGMPFRTALLVGLALCQVGEFSFILSKTGLQYGLLTETTYQIFLSVSIVTMGATPFLIMLAPRLANLMVRIPLPHRFKARFLSRPEPTAPYPEMYLNDHLIIIGYGLNGRNVAHTARITMIHYVIIEMNPETVRIEKARGEPIYYGDASQAAVLEAVRVKHAHVVVVAVPDAVTTRGIVAQTRQLSPSTHIIARTRTIREVEPLYKLGASEVIPEEFETSIEIFTRVLVKYHIPRDDIEAFISEIRSDGYGLFRKLALPSVSSLDVTFHLPETEMATFRLHPGSPLAGQTLAQNALRTKYGVTVLSIQRGDRTLSNPDGPTILMENDVVMLLGGAEDIQRVSPLFSDSGTSTELTD